MTESETLGTGEHPPPYIIFLVVFLFFLTGLLGFLICHLLKKKGYHCRTDMDDEEEEEKLGENADDDVDENQDTVEQILKCILENEANMEAFNEMLGNHNVCVRHDRRLRKESIGGIPPHLHTVHSGTDHNSCHLCAQIKSKKGRRQSRILRSKRPGEQTVFSVGRFRVTHTDKKSHGGSNPMAISGDQLDQSQDSEDRKDGGYNLRSMFKEVRQPSESASVVSANVGRQKKSVTIFGLRRGSDPVGIKVGEGRGWDTGGVKSGVQQQPAVLGEPLPAENIKVDPQRGIKADSKLETELETELQDETETSDSLNSASYQGKKEACHSSDRSEESTKLGLSPESGTKILFQSSSGRTAACAPSSLPIPLEKRVNVEDMWIKPESGPLQTSTPIVPMPTSIPGFTPVIHTGQHDTYSSTDFAAIQTLPDQSLPVKTPSSVSSLKTPTSPLAMTASPKLASRNMPSEAAKLEFPHALTPSPKLLHHQEMSRQSPVSYSSFRQSSSPSQARSLERELEVATLPKAEEKSEFKRPGILKKDKLLPVASGDFKGSALSSPSDFKDRCSSLPLSPSSLSPSSPQGGRISSVTIVKASPDSQREFSVVTMVEEEKSTTEDQKEDNYELGVELEKRVIGSADQEGDVFVPGVRQPETQSGETSGVEVIPPLSQEKDDMVEMEDIRDCKVMLVDGAKRVEEEVETKMQTQVEKD